MAARWLIEAELETEGGERKSFFSVPLTHDEQWRKVEEMKALGYKILMVHERDATAEQWADIERRMRRGAKVDIFAETSLADGKQGKVRP